MTFGLGVESFIVMAVEQIYKCFSDSTRLRMLNLLEEGPLCVCHLQEVLQQAQPAISRQLAFMKRKGILSHEKHHNWVIYSIADPVRPIVRANIEMLRKHPESRAVFDEDFARLRQLAQRANEPACALPPKVLTTTFAFSASSPDARRSRRGLRWTT